MSGTFSAEAGTQASLASMLSMYDTAQLIGTVENLMVADTFLLDNFFPNIVVSETEKVALDIDIGVRRMSPFTAPTAEARPVEGRRITTNAFTPAYIKDLRHPDLLRPVRRQYGERLMGGMTPAERLEYNLAYEIADQVDMVKRRMEWMAAQALVSGSYTVEGEGFPAVEVDFGRDSALTFALSGAAQWGQTGVSPSASIDAWQSMFMQKSGATPRDLIFTTSPWNAFKSDIGVLNSVLWDPRAGAAEINLGSQIESGGVFKGHWGNYRLWLFNDWFVDPATGIEQPMIPDGTVLMTSPQLDGTQVFGLIVDPEFSYMPMPYAPKMWIEKNPAQVNLLMQSAPLVIPSRANAVLSATVMAAGADVPGPGI
ncbi:major capsid protein [Komagataeibacter oboediens]|uniref:major capsid protein n=1 Tax=Komagataeibacter oboediens TaxID=65958 RepID=UPI001903ED03|nr:major capsid protein [Komagataeibacter oboediens]GCE81705.1 capsid protein of prophage [Komagataeibacter oboediens]